jgi:hypothetical protein
MLLMRLARMDQILEMSVMMHLIWSQCVQTWVHRNTTESSPNFKHIKVNPVPGRDVKAAISAHFSVFKSGARGI